MAKRGITETITFVLAIKNGQVAARDIERFGSKSEKALAKVESRTERAGAIASATGAKLLAMGTLAAFGLQKAAKATQDLRLAQLTTNKVFGSATTAIDRYAKVSVDRFGLSERAYRQATSQLGAFLNNLGFSLPEAADRANNLLGISTDLAAAFGRTTGEAVNAISAALRGERDTIEQFGVAIKQVDVNARVAALGLDVSTQEAKKNAEAVATLSLITEQAAQFQGIYASEQNKANRAAQEARASAENMAAAIGEAALPAVASVTQAIADLIGGFNDLPAPIRNAISETAVWTTGILLAFGAISKLTGSVLGLIGNLKSGSGLLGLLGKLGPTGLLAAGGIAAVTFAVFQWRKGQQEAKARQEALTEAMRLGGDETVLLTDRMAELVNKIIEYKTAAADAEDPTAELVGGVSALITELTSVDDLEAFNKTIAQMGLSAQDVADELGTGTDAFHDWAGLLADVVTQMAEGRTEFDSFAHQVVAAGLAAGLTEDEVGQLIRSFDRFADAADDSRESLEATNRETLEAAAAAGIIEDAALRAALATAEASGATEAYTAVLPQFESQVEAAANEVDALAAAEAATGDEAEEAAPKLEAFGTKIIGDIKNPADQAREALDRARTALSNLLDESTREIDREANLDELAEGLRDGSGSFDIDTAEGRRNRGNLNTVLADLIEEAEILAGEGKSLDVVKSKLDGLVDDAIGELSEYGVLTEQIRTELEGYPDTILTNLELSGYDETTAKLLELETFLSDVTRARSIFITPNFATSPSPAPSPTPSAPTIQIPGLPGAPSGAPRGVRGHGGRVGAGASYIVGERGMPEVLQMGSAGGRITPIDTAVGGGGDLRVAVVIDGREIGHAVVKQSQIEGGLPIRVSGVR